MREDVLISVNPPYSEMILNGYKHMEFRKSILNCFYRVHCLPMGENIRLIIYETKNKGGCGKVVGTVEVPLMLRLAYVNDLFPGESLAKERFDACKNLYLAWCENQGVKPNMNEGWFGSKRFNKYMDEIGWGGNFGLYLFNPIQYTVAKELSDFEGRNGNPITRPPQNMMYCKETSDEKIAS